jgi:hypothetical protein
MRFNKLNRNPVMFGRNREEKDIRKMTLLGKLKKEVIN